MSDQKSKKNHHVSIQGHPLLLLLLLLLAAALVAVDSCGLWPPFCYDQVNKKNKNFLNFFHFLSAKQEDMNNPECIRSKLLAIRQARYVEKSHKN